MGLPTLKTKERTHFGKSSAKKLRCQGLTPAVVYGEKKDPVHVILNPRDIERLFRNEEKGRNTLITLEIEGEKKTQTESVMVYQIQKNAITQFIEHVDFIRVLEKTAIRAIVPVSLVGSAPGLKMGGVLIHKLREIVIKCLPQDIPVSFDVDMTQLKVDEFFKVKDLNLGDITIISNLDDTIVRIAAPRTVVEETDEESDSEDGEEGDDADGGAEAASGDTGTTDAKAADSAGDK